MALNTSLAAWFDRHFYGAICVEGFDADSFQHLFHLSRDGGPKLSLGLSGEMEAIDTIG